MQANQHVALIFSAIIEFGSLKATTGLASFEVDLRHTAWAVPTNR
jgi:hypothetical protein